MTEENFNKLIDLNNKIIDYKNVKEHLSKENASIEYAIRMIHQSNRYDKDNEELKKYISEASDKIKQYVDIVIDRSQKEFDES